MWKLTFKSFCLLYMDISQKMLEFVIKALYHHFYVFPLLFIFVSIITTISIIMTSFKISHVLDEKKTKIGLVG